MKQSKKRSLIEAWVNIVIGYAISFLSNMLILPLFGFNITVKQNVLLVVIYKTLSLIRIYFIRRWFNK